MYPSRNFFLLTLLWLTPMMSSALDRESPIELEADQVELDEQAGTSTYRGNVRLTQGKLLLEAESIVVYLKNNTISRMLASGKPARLNDQLPDKTAIEAAANNMDYDVTAEEILLTGEGMLNQNGNVLNNDRIRYNIKTGTLSAGGSDSQQRVKVILQPAVNPK